MTAEVPPPDRRLDNIAPPKPLGSESTMPQPGQSFQSYVERGAAPGSVPGSEAPTPIDLSRTTSLQVSTPTVPSLLAQARAAQDTLGRVQKQLQTPNLQLKRSQAHLMRNKLTDARDYTQAAATKLGLDSLPMSTPDAPGVVARFLSYINDGQNQFAAIQAKLNEMATSGQQMNPGDMMVLQSKMALAQQEIEYSSVLLSRITSSITTIMSIQL